MAYKPASVWCVVTADRMDEDLAISSSPPSPPGGLRSSLSKPKILGSRAGKGTVKSNSLSLTYWK